MDQENSYKAGDIGPLLRINKTGQLRRIKILLGWYNREPCKLPQVSGMEPVRTKNTSTSHYSENRKKKGYRDEIVIAENPRMMEDVAKNRTKLLNL